MPKYAPKPVFQTVGICSPYIAVLLGVFLLRNGFLAVLLYHLALLPCIIRINKSSAIKLLFKGFHRIAGPLICLGGLVPGIVILYLWPLVRGEQVDLAKTLATLNLNGQLFIFFAAYAYLVNPFLEESFWRGCFKNETRRPNAIDMLFAGYHALAVFPVLKLPFVCFVFAAMTVVGWLFRTLYRHTGGLLTPLLLHIIADISILYAIWKIMQSS